MTKCKYLLYLLTAVLIMGCGQSVVETLHIPDNHGQSKPGKGMTMVILPFADYTYADSIAGAYRRNLSVSEALTDQIVTNGFNIAIQEDVFGYLIDEEIISVIPYDENSTSSLSNELQSSDWSHVMKGHLQQYIQQQKMQSGHTVSQSPGTHALDQKAVAKIGRKFNADYIVRGRILEFKTREETTWNPLKKGLLPFSFGLSSQTLNGFARSDTYDDWGHMLLPGTIGAIVGYNGSINGLDKVGNAMVWGAVGAGLGHMAKGGGQVDQAVVQLRIWVQEAVTGNLVWTNRVEVKVSPESIYSDRQYDVLFDTAVNKAVTTLIDNFVSTGL